MEETPINRLDAESLQRGARTFVNYCLNCHSAKYMRYNRLTDLGLTDAQIRNNLLFAGDKIGDTMAVAMRPADAKAWFGVPPPAQESGARRVCFSRSVTAQRQTRRRSRAPVRPAR